MDELSGDQIGDKLWPAYGNNKTLAAIFLNGSATEEFFQDDGVWLISTSFVVFTMTSGFGLLESGRVSSKDEVNIMVKNAIDVLVGGIAYWMFGFGLTFGDRHVNGFVGWGRFFWDPEGDNTATDSTREAWSYAAFLFQTSFATTTSTIVSASMAERIRLRPYLIITFIITLSHAVVAHWVWSVNGFFAKMGVIDAAGCSVVHLVGGVSGLVATIYLKPRQGRFGDNSSHQMSNPTGALLGTFTLWQVQANSSFVFCFCRWGWLGFNTGSTFGVVVGRWRLAAKSAVVTILSSMGGGCISIVISLIWTKRCQPSATTIRPLHSVIVGVIGSTLALATYPVIERLRIDDPVGVIPVHVVAALAVGIFAHEDRYGLNLTNGRNGLIYGGGFKLLAVQALCVVAIFAWSVLVTLLSLMILNRLPWGLRMTPEEEKLGADLLEHGLQGENVAKWAVEREPMSAKTVSNIVTAVAKWKRMARRAQASRNPPVHTANSSLAVPAPTQTAIEMPNGANGTASPLPTLSSIVSAAVNANTRRASERQQNGRPLGLVSSNSIGEERPKRSTARIQRRASVALPSANALEMAGPSRSAAPWTRLKRKISPRTKPNANAGNTHPNGDVPWILNQPQLDELATPPGRPTHHPNSPFPLDRFPPDDRSFPPDTPV
ncbi:Ammonium transporter [Aphelenchoides fujianensis]|nr:Ammonium transporter [Aphelenchoides fujianensis]